ncbi:Nitroreductase [Paenibacillus sp. UNCCL117]|uniref:nitroreductase family protein n=1 Tax=unclassified Paenibacillus TaxID=185978 RepID=UPI00088413B2|nr:MULTISPECIES: nitroreductase family protein [unclassified Paenibacillus]SDC21950.1 Nitroreductase [Paenibacillus sp. cl123]SFW18922.1 Nitroreductase [Paenibacillus sp. UNCCL117]
MSIISNLSELQDAVREHRKPEADVTPLFLNRWSPRAFSDRKVSGNDLQAVLEAAHWAPSSYNDQPWRFIVATEEDQLEVFRSFLGDFNKLWATKAPVLIVVASDKLRENGDPNGAHAFDAGAAWGYLALQASLKGLISHAIGGFDREKARQLLNVPDHFELHAVIALGYQGDKNELPEALQAREIPNTRKPLSSVVFEGKVN